MPVEVAIVAIMGLPGVGKTTVVNQFLENSSVLLEDLLTRFEYLVAVHVQYDVLQNDEMKASVAEDLPQELQLDGNFEKFSPEAWTQSR